MRIGGRLAGRLAKGVFSKELLAVVRRFAAKVGVKLLQRTIVNYTVPFASIAIGSTWNYYPTKTVGKIAIQHFKRRIADCQDMPGVDLSAGGEAPPEPEGPPS